MTNVLIDPIIIATPSEGVTKQIVEEWFDRLGTWLNAITNPAYGWFYSLEAITLLQSCNRFPRQDVIGRLFDKYGIDIDDIQISQRLNLFFQDDVELKIQELKQKLKEEPPFLIELQPGSSAIRPIELYERWPSPDVQNEMTELLIWLGIYKAVDKWANKESFATDIVMATQPLLENSQREVQIEAVIKDSMPEFILAVTPNLKQTIELKFIPEDLPEYNKTEIGIKTRLLKEAKYIKASEYYSGKHVDGKTDAERRLKATDNTATRTQGNGQYLIEFDDTAIEKLEREAIEKGRLIPRTNDDLFFITYTFEYDIGYAAPSGELTKTILTEWTSGHVHSHPILKP
jgi:hypothetical protein